MDQVEKENNTDRLRIWHEHWNERDIGFHQPIVNTVLKEQLSLWNPKNVFVPLCGKTIDMKWLSDEGYHVTGLDGIKSALVEFFTDQGLEWTETPAPSMGPGCSKLQSKHGNICLYCGDVFLFNKCLEGEFDFIWDRASLVALNRDDVSRYVEVSDNVLSPGGKILVETVEYDVTIVAGAKNTPPPFPMYEADIRSLFEPKFSVEFLERQDQIFRGHDIHKAYYSIIKS